MKKNLTIVVMCLILAFGCVACSSADKEKTYTVEFIDGDTIESAVLPYKSVTDAYAFEMMQLQKVTVEVTFDGKGTYTYTSRDLGAEDPEDPMYFDRKWTFTGSYTEDKGTYTLAAPTSATKDYKCSSTFAGYEDAFGKPGTFTEKDMPELLTGFSPCTATVDDTSISFTLK